MQRSSSPSRSSRQALRHALSSTCSGVVSAALLLAPVLASPGHAQEGDGFSFDIVEEGVQDTDTARIDKAKDLLSQERFAEALAELEGILGDQNLKRFHAQTEYDIAKTFYRMGAYHAALNRYQVILDAGPKHEFYGQARNWLFFISRKTKDELSALQMISTYAKPGDIPSEQQNELSYALSRFYFLLALNQGAKGVEVEQSEDPPPAEPASVPDPDAVDPGTVEPAPEGATEDPPTDPVSDDGLEFSADDLGGGDDDGFGFDFSGGDEPKKSKGKGKGKGKGKDPKKEVKESTPPAATPAPATAPVETKRTGQAPGKSKAHKVENPKNADASLEASLKAISRVDDKFPLYAQALYLKGLVHFAKGDFDPAVKAFRNVVRMTNPRGGGADNANEYKKLREMAFFSLARIHYQFEQFRYAIFYYDRISRDSEQWLESVFESSWAHFRLGEYEKGLGNLVTLQSPFFLDEYYPESSILKAITFYENCRYPEARAFLSEFKQNYGGVLTELNGLVGTPRELPFRGEGATGAESTGAKVKSASPSKTAEQLFEELTALERKVAEGKDDAARSIALTARLLRLALSDKRVAGFRAAIAEVDEEKVQITSLEAHFAGGVIQTELLKSLGVRRAELVNGAGALLRDKLEAELKFLKELSSKLVRIQFEIAKMEKETIEATITNQDQTVDIAKYGYTTATDDERLYWPFEGEYWRDELGTYQYTLTKGCRPPVETTITGE